MPNATKPVGGPGAVVIKAASWESRRSRFIEIQVTFKETNVSSPLVMIQYCEEPPRVSVPGGFKFRISPGDKPKSNLLV